MTLKGNVVQERPSLYRQNSVTIRVSEVLGHTRERANFYLRVNVPQGAEIVQGSRILMRILLKDAGRRAHNPVVLGRVVPDGWLSDPITISIVDKGRERFSKAIRDLGHSPALGLLGAISLGERWRVDVRTRDILRKTGTYHLLAISGVHVAAAVLPFLLLLRLGASASPRTRPRVSRAILLFLFVCATAYYIYFTGLSASAMRAVIYFILAGLAFVAGRGSISLISLSWCVVVIVCFRVGNQPDLSLTLSALAVTGIILSHKGHESLFKGLLRMTLGAVLFTLPVVVWIAGGTSVTAPVGNIVTGIPFGLLLIPAAVLMDLAAPLPWFPLKSMILIWLKITSPVLETLAHLADLPFSFLRLSPAGCLTVSIGAVIGILIFWRMRYRLDAGIAVFLAIIAVSGGVQLMVEKIGRGDLVIVFPEVGQADAAIVRNGNKTVLVDCGPVGIPGRDSPVARALRRLGVRKIDAVFVSHNHPDHTGGLLDILTLWPVDVIYVSCRISRGKDLENIKVAGHAGIMIRSLGRGDRVKIGSLMFTVYGPGEGEIWEGDINRLSLQLLLEVDEFKALFTGDAGWDQVQQSLETINGLDLLKIPHHGSKKGFPPPGMDGSITRIGRSGEVITVCPSRNPGSGHLPAQEVVTWFEERGLKLLYTADTGVKIRYKKSRAIGNRSTVVDNHYRF